MTTFTQTNNYTSPSAALALRIANSCLLTLIVLINLYTIGIPLRPSISFWFGQHFGSVASSLSNIVNNPEITPSQVFEPDEIIGGKRLIIPSLLLDKPIYEGNSPGIVHKGVWRLPHTSTPDAGSNTVFVGHRFSYKDPAVFYNLDKMEKGQRFAVFWNQHKYLYEVMSKDVVAPTRIDIEAPTTESRLTLYTCTPLWTAKNRLVVVAKLVEKT